MDKVCKHSDDIILETQDLCKYFKNKHGKSKENVVRAVDKVSLQIRRGETLAVVGESGCGKSTLGRTILHLYEPTSGKVIFEGKEIHKPSAAENKALRKKMQIVFQDPYASLNPRMKVSDILAEPIRFHEIAKGSTEIRKAVEKVMMQCGLPAYVADRYPHEFSGGQRQRISIARALSVQPSFVVLDEPVSALDVSIQSQIINLLQDLQEKQHLTYLFISHDLSVVHHIANRVVVMYLGTVMELADKDDLYENPAHPYTRALLSAIPKDNPKEQKERIILNGEIPSPANPPSGCKFRTRCQFATEACAAKEPALREVTPGHFVACDRYEDIHL